MGISPAHFYLQKSMHHIFSDLLSSGVHIYLDDIVVHAFDEATFIYLVSQVLERFRSYNLRCKASKCLVGAGEISILGHILSGDGVRMSRDRIGNVLNIPHPSTTKELRRVLGVTNYMRRFIPNYAEIVAPLTSLVNGTKKDLTSPAAKDAFQDLLAAVDDQLSLHHLRYDYPIVVTTDASMQGLGGILSNIYDDGSERVVACVSHKFTAAESNWKTIEQEAFAIVYCLQHWYDILWGVQFLLRTDHRNLLYVHGGTSAKVIRWSLLTQGLSFLVTHISGEDNWLPDMLSRYPLGSDQPHAHPASPTSVSHVSSPPPSDDDYLVSASDVEQFDEEDGSVDLDYDDMPPLQSPDCSDDEEDFTDEVYRVYNNRVQPPRRAKVTQSASPAAVAPTASSAPLSWEVKEQIILATHNSIVGHHGINRTIQLLRSQGYNWPHLARDVSHVVAKCAFCQKDRLTQPEAAAIYGQLQAYALYEELSIDFIGPLPTDTMNNCYIFNAVCNFSHYAELMAVEAATAVVAAHCLLTIVSRYGCFRRLRSDRGSHFVNLVIAEFLALFEIQHILTLAERPQANGMVERQGGEVMRHLRALVFDAATKFLWSLLLPLVQRILNRTYRHSIGCMPNQLVYVSAPDLDRGIFEPFREPASLAIVTTSYMQQLRDAHEHLLDLTSIHVDQEQELLRRKYNLTVPTEFPIGSLVLVSYLTRPTSKLHTRKAGPFLVMSRNANNVTIQNLTSGVDKVMDVSRLTPFLGEPSPTQAQALAAADLGEISVASIIAVQGNKLKRKSLTFLVRWDDGDETWEPWDTVKRLTALDVFIAANPGLGLNYLLAGSGK